VLRGGAYFVLVDGESGDQADAIVRLQETKIVEESLDPLRSGRR
jgi:hypothetical protein